jgi:hypothetical protein
MSRAAVSSLVYGIYLIGLGLTETGFSPPQAAPF